MKLLKILLFVLFFFGLFTTNIFAIEKAVSAEKESSAVVSEQNNFKLVQAKKTTKELTVKERFISKRLKKLVKRNHSLNPQEDEVLLVILAILLPPLAVYLLEGLTTNFWIDVILSLFFWLPGIIFALYLILR